MAPFARVIKHFDLDSTTLLNTISSTAISDPRGMQVSFELLRLGGCGSGSVTLSDEFVDRGTFSIGQFIEVLYDGSTPWYFGRIENIQEVSPSHVTLSLYGLWSELSEVWPGGFGGANDNAPHRYENSSYWGNDPDYALDTNIAISQPEQFLCLIYEKFILPATNIGRGVIESPSPQVGMDGVKMRGEESVAAIIRSVSTNMKTASFGVDETKKLFVKQLRSHVVKVFQEGSASVVTTGEVENLSRVTDRSLMYNRLLITGGYLYGTSIGPGFYRFQATFRQADSITLNGERRWRAFVPWIRRNADAIQFAKEFFRKYARPTVRYSFRSSGQDTLLRPWDGRIRIKAADGSTMVTSHFDRVQVDFNEIPKFTITVGPEDIQFPIASEHQRFEVAHPTDRGDGETAPDASVDSLADFAGHSSGEALVEYSC